MSLAPMTGVVDIFLEVGKFHTIWWKIDFEVSFLACPLG